jgi:CheY-like chemotaxis protein
MPSTQSILIVEDDLDLQTVLADLLTGEGYSVRTANDGQQALDLFGQGFRPNVALIDLMLPRISGWELLKHMRKDPELQDVRSIVLTAVPRDDVKVVTNVVFQKPLDSRKLLRTIKVLAEA